MPKFEIGDTVVIKSDLIVGKSYGYCTFLESMMDLLGKIVHIKQVYGRGSYYAIEESQYNFTDEMFEPFKIGDKVRAIKASNDYYVSTNEASNWEGKVIRVSKDGFCAKTTNTNITDQLGVTFEYLRYEYFTWR